MSDTNPRPNQTILSQSLVRADAQSFVTPTKIGNKK